MAALSSMEARIRIKSDLKLSPTLSITGSLSCSRYNQGCNGGYPYLVGKQGHDIGFFEVFFFHIFTIRNPANRTLNSRNSARRTAFKRRRSGK